MPADYMTTESRLPFSLEAEQSVLGAALLDAGCVPDLVRLVRPEFFYRALGAQFGGLHQYPAK